MTSNHTQNEKMLENWLALRHGVESLGKSRWVLLLTDGLPVVSISAVPWSISRALLFYFLPKKLNKLRKNTRENPAIWASKIHNYTLTCEVTSIFTSGLMFGRKKIAESGQEWTKTGSFMNKPERGWLHSEESLREGGVCYAVRVRNKIISPFLLLQMPCFDIFK